MPLYVATSTIVLMDTLMHLKKTPCQCLPLSHHLKPNNVSNNRESSLILSMDSSCDVCCQEGTKR